MSPDTHRNMNNGADREEQAFVAALISYWAARFKSLYASTTFGRALWPGALWAKISTNNCPGNRLKRTPGGCGYVRKKSL